MFTFVIQVFLAHQMLKQRKILLAVGVFRLLETIAPIGMRYLDSDLVLRLWASFIPVLVMWQV
jgi:hypothetical protein